MATALELADAHRELDTFGLAAGVPPPFALWRAARAESEGRQDRVVRYRHAMIHAGHLLTRKGKPYKRCPMCHHLLK